MIRIGWRWTGAAALVFALLTSAACTTRPDPIVLDEGMLTIQNQSSSDWTHVVVTINDYFNAGAPTLLAGGILRASVTEFRTAFGQKYDRTRQSVYKVEVKATDESGQPVHLEWNGARAPQ